MVNLIEDLKPLVEMPFRDKYAITETIVARNLREFRDDAAVAWSGGKDSTLVLYLVRRLWPDIRVVFNNTGVEYPETVKYVEWLADEWNLNLITTLPSKNFWQCANEFGFPSKTKHGRNVGGKDTTPHCCYYLKEKPMFQVIRQEGLKCLFDGVTAVESWVRMFTARDKGTCYQNKKWNVKKVRPILYWTEEEVFQFCESEGVPLNPRYAQGAKRVGCMTCTAYKTWEANMFAENPKLYAIIKRRKDAQGVFPI